MKNLKSLVVIICLIVISGTYSQEKKPKIALVLSGGGAKGIAHVTVLKKLDSLGIVPDLVVGTSMGSVVGGLYSIGYSADSIEYHIKTLDWSQIMLGTTSMRDVSIEEKSEFERYLMNLDVIKGKPKLKPAFLEDQNLREYLASLIYPVYDINDFNEFAIPFRSVTTDLVNGKEVVISEGSLTAAIRASMSIPGVFEPVSYNGTLLVDGGILNNFPVNIAKELGADIIIGSDVGGGLQKKERLNNVGNILFQTSMLTSNLRNDSQRELCDILIDHTANLTYSTQDFEKNQEILKQGSIATNQKTDELIKLAKILEKFPQRSHELPQIASKITFSSIDYQKLSNENKSLVNARMNLKEQVPYSTTEIKMAIERAMGTELFHQITFDVVKINDKTILELEFFEKASSQIGGSIHYDTNQGVGLIVNYTGRNIFGHSSRLLLGVDIAEQPKFRVEYQQNIGDLKTWWWRTQIFGQKMKQSYYSYGDEGELLKNSYLKANLQLNKNIHPLFSYVGLDVNYEYFKAKPKVNPSVNNNIYDLRRYSSNTLEVSAYYYLNTMNKVFFPTDGTQLLFRVSRSLCNSGNVEYYEFSEFNVSGETNGFTKVNFQYEKRFPFIHKHAFVLGASAGLTFIDSQKSNQLSFIEHGQGAKYFIGGNLNQNRRYSIPLKGLSDSELIVTQFAQFNLAVQVNLFGSIYLTPHTNFASVGFTNTSDYFNDFFKQQNNWTETQETSYLLSSGMTLSYDSLLGPVNFDVSYVNDVEKLQLFLSVGLIFNIWK
ncbi:patatin-like phospholipase family protein [Hanstruepera ponticola]|uniref:patatin-like phospholipase family protein n=1 Tax=Hanstruepera ponticola TaxID=2042995 RepID=UPI0017854CB3|nr:patatin-like phospholipase family protein [Hanstruepera ponticola]